MADASLLLIAGAALAAIGGFAFAFSELHKARLIENTPTSRIRSAAQGYVELEGLARLLPGPEIRSPLSGTRCCWWRYRVQKRERNDRRNAWRTIDSASSDELFLLVDSTGECIVDPVGARIHSSLKRSWRGESRLPGSVPPKIHWLQFGDYRYDEELIQFGDPIYALGWFRTQSGAPAFDESRDVGELLREWKTDQRELLRRFDSDGDGRIDAAEWEVARRDAATQVRQQQLEQSIDPDLHVLCRPTDRRPYLISTRSQQQLARRHRIAGATSLLLSMATGAYAIISLTTKGLL